MGTGKHAAGSRILAVNRSSNDKETQAVVQKEAESAEPVVDVLAPLEH